MRIIPAIDIIEGKCVRLEKGNYKSKVIYGEDPLEMAKKFEAAGLVHLHLVDLDGAKIGFVKHQKILENIKTNTNLIVDYGGGIRKRTDVESLFNAGADQVNIGSIAVKEPELVYQILKDFGAETIVLSPDVQDEYIAIHGWQESSNLHIFDFLADFVNRTASYFVCTDIEKDGMLSGSSIDLYKKILSKFPDIKLIASGGVTSENELSELLEIGIDGVIIGKAIYEGKIKLENLVKYVS